MGFGAGRFSYSIDFPIWITRSCMRCREYFIWRSSEIYCCFYNFLVLVEIVDSIILSLGREFCAIFIFLGGCLMEKYATIVYTWFKRNEPWEEENFKSYTKLFVLYLPVSIIFK